MTDNSINELCYKILRQEHEIIDLFCKTFLLSQQPKSIEELKYLFSICSLEICIKDDLSRIYTIKLKDKCPPELREKA